MGTDCYKSLCRSCPKSGNPGKIRGILLKEHINFSHLFIFLEIMSFQIETSITHI